MPAVRHASKRRSMGQRHADKSLLERHAHQFEPAAAHRHLDQSLWLGRGKKIDERHIASGFIHKRVFSRSRGRFGLFFQPYQTPPAAKSLNYHQRLRFRRPSTRHLAQNQHRQGREQANLYCYTKNDPTSISDPYGLWGVKICGINLGWGIPTYDFDFDKDDWTALRKQYQTNAGVALVYDAAATGCSDPAELCRRRRY